MKIAADLTNLWSGMLLSVPSLISIAPTHSRYQLADSPMLNGRGASHVGSILISNGSGTIELDGEKMTTLIQQRIPWGSQDVTLYQGLAFDAQHWDIYWIYCEGTVKGSQMSSIFYEGISGPEMTSEVISGTCQDSHQPTSILIELPAIRFQTPVPIRGFALQGANIHLDSGEPGTLQTSRELLHFIPFSTVNCSDCGNGGWYELHSVFWDEAQNQTCFGIIYLDLATEDNVTRVPTLRLRHSFCLPDLGGIDADYPGTWKAKSPPSS